MFERRRLSGSETDGSLRQRRRSLVRAPVRWPVVRRGVLDGARSSVAASPCRGPERRSRARVPRSPSRASLQPPRSPVARTVVRRARSHADRTSTSGGRRIPEGRAPSAGPSATRAMKKRRIGAKPAVAGNMRERCAVERGEHRGRRRRSASEHRRVGTKRGEIVHFTGGVTKPWARDQHRLRREGEDDARRDQRARDGAMVTTRACRDGSSPHGSA